MRRWLTVILVAFVAFIVNFPLAHATYLFWPVSYTHLTLPTNREV